MNGKGPSRLDSHHDIIETRFYEDSEYNIFIIIISNLPFQTDFVHHNCGRFINSCWSILFYPCLNTHI